MVVEFLAHESILGIHEYGKLLVFADSLRPLGPVSTYWDAHRPNHKPGYQFLQQFVALIVPAAVNLASVEPD